MRGSNWAITFGMVAALACSLSLGAPSAVAQMAGGGSSSGQKRSNHNNDYVLSNITGLRARQIQKLIGKKKYAQARKAAERALSRAKSEGAYPYALMELFIAQTYMLQHDLVKAEPYLKIVVRLDALQPGSQKSAIGQLANVYLSQKQYDDAIKLYKEVIHATEVRAKKLGKKPDVDPTLYYNLSMAYTFKGDFHSAMENIETAIRMAKTPHQDWYQNWFVVAYKLKDYVKANRVAKQLVAHWPKEKDYWTYYANTALQIHNDAEGTAIYELMNKRGLLTNKDDYSQLTSLLLEQNAPFKAGTILQQGMAKGVVPKTPEQYDTLAQAWIQAREWHNALEALGREAALAPTGKVYLRQASIYLQQQDYARAAEAARNAIKKGGLNQPGRAWLALGQAAFEQKNLKTALRAFHKAAQYQEQRKDAENWIKYVHTTSGTGTTSGR